MAKPRTPFRDAQGRYAKRPARTVRPKPAKGYLLTEAIEDEPVGSQTAFSIETPRNYVRRFGLSHPYPLERYLRLIERDHLAYTCLLAIVYLITSPLRVVADNPDLQAFVEDFNRRIEIERVIFEMGLDTEWAGFGGQQIIGDAPSLVDSNRILGLFRIDPRSLYVDRDERGRTLYYIQRPAGYGPFSGPLGVTAQLDPESVVYCSSYIPGVYGQSVFRAPYRRFRERQRLVDAMVAAAENHASPIVLWFYQSDPTKPENREEIKAQIASLKRNIRKARAEKRPDLQAAGTGNYTAQLVGPQQVADITKQYDELSRDIITACGLDPSTVGYQLGQGVTTSAASARATVNAICVRQNRIVRALEKLYSLIPLVESDCPTGDFRVELEPPSLETLTEAAQRMSTVIANVGQLGRMGMIDDEGQQGASMLGLQDCASPDKWKEYCQSQSGTMNPRDPNSQQQNVAAANSSRLRGNDPSNNPSGGKGNTDEK